MFETEEQIRLKLDELTSELKELLDELAHLKQRAPGDDLAPCRLKKRKHLLQDQIALLERMLDPGSRA